MIYTIRTTTGREDIVMDLLESRLKNDQGDIKSVFHPAEIKGYVFVEGGLASIHRAMVGLMHVKGLMEKPVNLEEIRHFLEVKRARIKIEIDDVVEIIGGPFKGERGRIKRIDSVKDEVTIELLEAAIPIPVTIATEFIKVVKKAHPETAAEKEKSSEPEAESDKSIFDDIKESAKSEAVVSKKDDDRDDEKMNDENSAEAGAQDEADKAEGNA